MNIVKTADMLGIQRDVPLNYVPRSHVDTVFIDSLTRSKHIVVYGSSKQGKTSSSQVQSQDRRIHQRHLRFWLDASGVTGIDTEGGRLLRSTKYNANHIGGTQDTGESWRWFEYSHRIRQRDGGGESTKGEAIEEVSTALELDPSDELTSFGALTSIAFKRYIVLEDFHYLLRSPRRLCLSP